MCRCSAFFIAARYLPVRRIAVAEGFRSAAAAALAAATHHPTDEETLLSSTKSEFKFPRQRSRSRSRSRTLSPDSAAGGGANENEPTKMAARKDANSGIFPPSVLLPPTSASTSASLTTVTTPPSMLPSNRARSPTTPEYNAFFSSPLDHNRVYSWPLTSNDNGSQIHGRGIPPQARHMRAPKIEISFERGHMETEKVQLKATRQYT